MNDRNGTPLAIGDKVEWMGMDNVTHTGWVRRFGRCYYRGTPVAVVDDGAQDNPDHATNGYREARVIDAPERVVRVGDGR